MAQMIRSRNNYSSVFEKIGEKAGVATEKISSFIDKHPKIIIRGFEVLAAGALIASIHADNAKARSYDSETADYHKYIAAFLNDRKSKEK